MVFTGYEGFGIEGPEDAAEWLPYADQGEWDQSLAVYGGMDIVSNAEEQQPAHPSLNQVMSLIDYDLAMKHPLEHTWTLWHWENDRRKSWTDMLSDVTSFNTVEDFFSVYYFIKPPSDLKVFNDYMVFKQGVRPMWEDDVNKEGGRWIMLLDKVSKTLIDKLWHDLLLCTIGECFEYSDQICGVVINVRNKANKLSLWTKDSRNAQAILSIGRQMKELLQLEDMEIQYQVHKDAMVQHGPNVYAIYKL